VGATTILDEIAAFSSRGPVSIDSSFRLKPNITAPGVNVLSTIRNGGFARFSGTSMSGPHVAVP
jgi:subtilisin family serine protease